jgi:L-lactate dehydrogenase (cytochrome)
MARYDAFDVLRNVTSIEDLRKIAKRRVPRAFFQYADHGSYTQSTMRANRADLEKIKLRQRVGIDVGTRDLSTTIAGERAALPLVLAPIGMLGMQQGDGEILSCRAAHAAEVPFCLSTMSIASIEDVAASVTRPFWFQLYMIRDRGFVRDLIARALAAKCSVLVPTLDLNVLGVRYADVKNGLTVPISISAANLIDVATKPEWAAGVARAKRKTFGNLAGHVRGMEGVNSLSTWISKQFDPTLTWKDIEWVREQWPGKLVLKGILDVEDAKIAAKTGATGIVVSNHGGRQLDGAPSSISMLPKIADAVGSELELLFDGGVRSGQDVLRALALGARACMIGRAYVYGLGAGGQEGVAKALEIIRDQLDITMALTGSTSVANLDRSVLG